MKYNILMILLILGFASIWILRIFPLMFLLLRFIYGLMVRLARRIVPAPVAREPEKVKQHT